MDFLYIYSRLTKFSLSGEARLCWEESVNGVPQRRLNTNTEIPKERDPYLEHLAHDREWLTLIREYPELLTTENVTDYVLKNNLYDSVLNGERVYIDHPLIETLHGLEPAERQDLFIEFIDRYIPSTEQNTIDISNIYPPQERRAKVMDKITMINGIFAAMHGVNDWNRVFIGKEDGTSDALLAEKIARSSLTNYYKNPDQDYPDTLSTAMYEDVRNGLLSMKTSGFKKIDAKPRVLESSLKEMSLLKGALKLGVITEEDMLRVSATMNEDVLKTNLIVGKVATNLDTLSKATKLQQQIETNNIKKMWNDMGGLGKFLTIAAGIYLLTRKNWVGTVAKSTVGIFAGLYAIQYFGLGDKDPLASWDRVLRAPGKLFNDNNQSLADAMGTRPIPKVKPDNINDRARKMVDFLDEFDRSNLERQATGFAILSNGKASTFAQNFNLSAGGQWGINFQDQVVRNEGLRALDGMKWDRSAYDQYFSDKDNCRFVNEAFGNFLYWSVARKPFYAEKVKNIEHVRRRLPLGSSLAWIDEMKFKDPDFKKQAEQAHKDYIWMIAEGKKNLVHTESTIGDVVADTTGLSSSMKDFEGKTPTPAYAEKVIPETAVTQNVNPEEAPEKKVEPDDAASKKVSPDIADVKNEFPDSAEVRELSPEEMAEELGRDPDEAETRPVEPDDVVPDDAVEG